MLRRQLAFPFFALVLLAAQCGPIETLRDILNSLATFTPTPTSTSESDADIWYVATDGDDGNSCSSPSTPCLTIFGAHDKAQAGDQILLAAGTYNDASRGGDLSIGEDLWIQGAGPGVTILETANLYISGSATVRLEGFTIQNPTGASACIDIRDEANVTIEQFEVTRCADGIYNSSSGLVYFLDVSVSQAFGSEFASGVGIYNTGTLQIENGGVGGNVGDGILNSGLLSVTSALIQNNGANGLSSSGEAHLFDVLIRNNGVLGSGAGLSIMDGGVVDATGTQIRENLQGVEVQGELSILNLEDSSVMDNTGMGLHNAGSIVQLTNVSVTGNGATLSGTLPGGIENEATLEIRNSHISQNSNGGLLNTETGFLTIAQSNIEENVGGQAAFFNSGTAEVESSLFANNTASGRSLGSDGAVENRGEMTMLNSTISGNADIGILVNDGTLSLSYVTVAGNMGGGIAAHRSGVLISQIANSLVVKNGAGDCAFPLGLSDYAGMNIDTDDTCGFSQTVSDAGIALAPLADNGGPTFTHALLPASPAIDAAFGTCPAADQRSAPRPAAAACDVGAYEAGSTPASTEEFVIPTGTPVALLLTVERDFPCYTGPGPAYSTLSTLKAGTQLQVVGYGFGGGWLVAYHPTLTDQHCWIDEDFVTVNVPLDQLRLISIPPKPTATPSPQGKNASLPLVRPA